MLKKLEKLGIPMIPSILIWLVTPAISFYFLESMTHVVSENMTWPIILLNLMIYYLIYGLILLLSKRSWVSLSVGSLFFMIVGLANYYVIEFRSVPIYPWDIFSLKTAASVSDNYNYQLESDTLVLVLGFLLLILVGLWTRWKLPDIKYRYYIGGVAVVSLLIGTYTHMVQTTEVHQAVGFYEYLFTPNAFYRRNGFMVSFLSNMQYLEVKKPDGYSQENVEEILEPYIYEAKEQDLTNVKPNVIVIMNEAFSDPSVLGEFETNMDYMPFIHSLNENTLKGNAIVSVKGGNTANSEYEFLTGNSMAYLPTGSIPYQQYIQEPMPSLASQLKKQGYETYAMHPYGATGWNRHLIYPYFGFDTCYFKQDFNSSDILRQYTTDLATYEKIVEIYHNKEAGKPMFVFDVTMQNHSSYSKEYDNFVPDIEVYGSEKDVLLERYLSLIKVSDQAFGALVRYFEQQDEPTVILMFGDHQPADWVVAPIYTMNGQTDSSGWSESLERYEVPFVLWANYDLDTDAMREKFNYEYIQQQKLSLNYMGTLLLEAAGLSKSAYQLYMEDLLKEYPIVAASGCYDVQGKCYDGMDFTEMPEKLKAYWMLNYNSLFDTENRDHTWYE